MAIGEGEAIQAQPARRRWRLTVMGLLGLVALAAIALFVYRRQFLRTEERPEIGAAFRSISPVADGVIGKTEYGTAVAITWTEDNTLAAFYHDQMLDPTTRKFFVDPTTSKKPSDLSVDAYAAYTETSLFLAFRVHDQFVDAQIEERPELDDGVEIFIDGDGVADDFSFDSTVIGGVRGSKEGFQIGGNAAGQRFTKSQDFADADWKSTAKRTDDGYIIEMEIPLTLIDTKDGPPFAPPGPGSLIHLGLAVSDNDAEVHAQQSYAYLKTAKQTDSPAFGGERAWNFGIKLEPKWSLFPW